MTLLEMALAQQKEQWYNGEVIWLIPHRAFLKNDGYAVNLCLVGYSVDCCIWYFDLQSWGWRRPNRLENRYGAWAEAARTWKECKKWAKEHHAKLSQ